MSKSDDKKKRHTPKWDDPLPELSTSTLLVLDLLFNPKPSNANGLITALNDHRQKDLQHIEFLYQSILADKDSWAKIEELKKVFGQLSLMCSAAKRKTTPQTAKPASAVTSTNPKDLETLNKMKQKLESTKKRTRERAALRNTTEEEPRKSQQVQKESQPRSELAKEYDDGEDSQGESSEFDFLATKE